MKVSLLRRKITHFSKFGDSNIIENDMIERLEKESRQNIQTDRQIIVYKLHTFSPKYSKTHGSDCYGRRDIIQTQSQIRTILKPI